VLDITERKSAAYVTITTSEVQLMWGTESVEGRGAAELELE
jgi:hypothetical protein